jgi:hypothetical protein
VTNEQLLKKLTALEHLLHEAATLAPKHARIAGLEGVRRLKQEVALSDTASLNRTLDDGKLLKRRRTRFFVTYANQHGVRLSALLFLLASHTRRRWEAGERGRKAGWRDTAKRFGEQIGVSGRQVYRLVGKGKKLQLLDHLRTRRGLLVWITNRKVYAQPTENAVDKFCVGHYYLRLARLLGINGSILYRFLRITDAEGGRRKLTGQSAAHRFPWLSDKAASIELLRLFRSGIIQRERARFALSTNADWMYFWHERTQKDREKWRLHTNSSSENC